MNRAFDLGAAIGETRARTTYALSDMNTIGSNHGSRSKFATGDPSGSKKAKDNPASERPCCGIVLVQPVQATASIIEAE